MRNNKKSGFTMIELLIVVSVLGVLAGVATVVINPRKAQNQAKDETIRAVMEKLAQSANAYYALEGEYPLCEQFLAWAPNASEEQTCPKCGCSGADDPTVNFSLPDIHLPQTCGSNGVSGQNGSSQCYFHYNGATPQFYAKAWYEDEDGNDYYYCWDPDASGGVIKLSCDRTCQDGACN